MYVTTTKSKHKQLTHLTYATAALAPTDVALKTI